MSTSAQPTPGAATEGGADPTETGPADGGLSRRAFLERSTVAGVAAMLPLSVLTTAAAPAADSRRRGDNGRRDDDDRRLSRGDTAILQFLAAAELLESDLWLQYAELGGVPTGELPGFTGGSAAYTNALQQLDGDMPQYISDNTEDEISHADFLNAYLAARGRTPVSLDRFRTLPSSRATGAQQIGRLTNLMRLTVDTGWYTRYRSRTRNPDLDPGFKFPPAVPSLSAGQFPAIPRSDADLAPQDHIQAIANTAGFHFATIEQGGTSLYPALAPSVRDPEVLRVLLSIGPTEACHFQTWHDKAGNAVNGSILPSPLVDPTNPALVFPNLNVTPGGEDFQTNLIMPEPCPFLSRMLPACSIIRPTSLHAGGALAAATGLMASGLFLGQSKEFFELLLDLASDADAAGRHG